MDNPGCYNEVDFTLQSVSNFSYQPSAGFFGNRAHLYTKDGRVYSTSVRQTAGYAARPSVDNNSLSSAALGLTIQKRAASE